MLQPQSPLTPLHPPSPNLKPFAEALAAGIENPYEGVAWIRERYGIEMQNTHFSTVKANERRKNTGDNSADLLTALETLKPLEISSVSTKSNEWSTSAVDQSLAFVVVFGPVTSLS